MLALALICALAVSAFADTISGTTVYAGTAAIESCLQLDDTFAKGSIVVEPNSDRCETIISMTYVTCPEETLRPSAYVTRSGSGSSNKTTGGSYTMNANNGMISIEATADYYVYVTVNGVAYTRYPADLYLER
jgi:hypothetical protein